MTDLGTVSLPGYSGVAEGRPPKRMGVFGYKADGQRGTIFWSLKPFPDEADVREGVLHPSDRPAYRVTLEVPHITRGRLSENLGEVFVLCDRALLAKLVRESVTAETLADYLTSPEEYRLGVYRDGSAVIGPHVGDEDDPENLPASWVRCPGLGGADMKSWRNGWACSHLTDYEVIRRACAEGDVSTELEDLHRKLGVSP